MSPFHTHGERLKCPYSGCGKTFDKPSALIDCSTIPRQTHYTCPYCMSKIDILTQNMKIVGVKATEYPKVFESPAKCAHYSGNLGPFSEDSPLPEECLLCPKVLQCAIRKRK